MAMPATKTAPIDGTKLGEYSATQPLSGVRWVNETFAVNGTGRCGYVRKEEAKPGQGRA
ncbi:MAG: hypothetical protein M3N08_01240 [Pseudomonadota bacterium]|nr:hypothetical protein [Pseudomonadota bacterium]